MKLFKLLFDDDEDQEEIKNEDLIADLEVETKNIVAERVNVLTNLEQVRSILAKNGVAYKGIYEVDSYFLVLTNYGLIRYDDYFMVNLAEYKTKSDALFSLFNSQSRKYTKLKDIQKSLENYHLENLANHTNIDPVDVARMHKLLTDEIKHSKDIETFSLFLKEHYPKVKLSSDIKVITDINITNLALTIVEFEKLRIDYRAFTNLLLSRYLFDERVTDTNYEDIFGFLDRLLEEYRNILNVFYNPNSNTGRTYLELFGYNNKLIWKAEY